MIFPCMNMNFASVMNLSSQKCSRELELYTISWMKGNFVFMHRNFISRHEIFMLRFFHA